MLIGIERLLVRVRQVPSRADELIALRTRLKAAVHEKATGEERELADAMRMLKARASAELGGVSSCGTCATGKRWPRGAFPGGDCCSSVTADLFDDDEVAALAQSGTRPRHLAAPRTDHAGCAFRGDMGCTLSADHRPARCVRYTCMTLRKELRAADRLDAIDALLGQLEAMRRAFVAARARRLGDEMFAPLEAALAPQCGPGTDRVAAR
jgi:hypothetical protein